MRRLLITISMAGLLAACGGGNGAGSDGASAPESITADASGSANPAGSGASGGAPSDACAEAFAPIAELGVESASDLGDLAEVEATVTSCESIDDWRLGAAQAIGSDVNPGTADLLLRIRCDDPSLSGSAICEELAGS